MSRVILYHLPYFLLSTLLWLDARKGTGCAQQLQSPQRERDKIHQNTRIMSTLHKITFMFCTKRKNSLKIRGREHALLLSSVQPYSLPLRYESLLAEEITEPGSPLGLCLPQIYCWKSTHEYFCAKLCLIAPQRTWVLQVRQAEEYLLRESWQA